jgi:polygalacturonase
MWGGSKRSFVRGFTFAYATMSGVENPIIIDQRYCPSGPVATGAPTGAPTFGSATSGTWASGSRWRPSLSTSTAAGATRAGDVALTYKSRPIAATKSCCRDVQGTTLDFVLPPSCL